MIYSKPTNVDIVPYSTVKIDGCSEAKLGFDFLSEQPSIGKRRYCNKVLVHECISVPEISPLELDRVEFLATDDPCYKFFNVYKSSDQIEEIEPAIELQIDEYDVIGVIITFSAEEIEALPLQMSYRLYGYDPLDNRMILAQGNLYSTPCGTLEDCKTVTWVGLRW